MKPNEVVYLGDGLYCQFDGFQFWLLANSHEHPTDRVALEPNVVDAFIRIVNETRGEQNGT